MEKLEGVGGTHIDLIVGGRDRRGDDIRGEIASGGEIDEAGRAVSFVSNEGMDLRI